jgi:four helix bundle protein
MQDFRQLKVWQKAHALTLELYEQTKRFPSDERFGLTSQMRRGSSSIGANIAEGCGVNSRVHFARYLQLASGSTSELAYHLILAKDLGYIEQKRFQAFAAQAARRFDREAAIGLEGRWSGFLTHD